jgi:hypothetical protein
MEIKIEDLEVACKAAEHALRKGERSFPLDAYKLLVEIGQMAEMKDLDVNKAKLLTLLLSMSDFYYKDEPFKEVEQILSRFFQDEPPAYSEIELNNYVFARMQRERPSKFDSNVPLKYYWLESYNHLGRDKLPEYIIKSYTLVCCLQSPHAVYEFLMATETLASEPVWQEFALYFLIGSSDKNNVATRVMVQTIMNRKYLTKYAIEEHVKPSLVYPIGTEKYSSGLDDFRTRTHFAIFAEIVEGLMIDEALDEVDIFSSYESSEVDDPILSICYFCATPCPKEVPVIVCVKCMVRVCTPECFEKNCSKHASECRFFSDRDST